MAKEIVYLADVEDAPAEASADLQVWRQFGLQSTLGIPLSLGDGPVFGVLSFDATHVARIVTPHMQKRLQLIAQIFANALERKRAEQRLRESEARLSLAAVSAQAGLWTLEPESGQIWATPFTRALFGLAVEAELDLATVMALVHPDDREKVQHAIGEAMRTGVDSSVDYRIQGPDGELRWISSRGRREDGVEGQPDRLMGVTTDITQSKRNERELAELRERLQAESDYLKEEILVRDRFDEMVGQSAAIRKVFQQIELVAPTDSMVLIMGETGTGKELVARAIHSLSRRKDRVMVKIDCSSLPASLIEAELFGREKGAYTGALTKQAGRFELANGSTLFLDEIGELPLELQAKLLRVVQDGEFERLGSPKTLRVDVRVIAATNRNLAERVKDGSFRQDLYYRLNVFPVHVPPLRDRSEDIPLLTWAFVKEFERKMGKKIESIPKKTMEGLQSYGWPGNVRELKNEIERALIVTSGSQLNLQVPQAVDNLSVSTLKGMEQRHIVAVLEKTNWRVKGPGGAAELLGMKPTTLYATMQRLGIQSWRQRYDTRT